MAPKHHSDVCILKFLREIEVKLTNGSAQKFNQE